MDTDIALAGLASGMTVLIGAECSRGVHDTPPGCAWKHCHEKYVWTPVCFTTSLHHGLVWSYIYNFEETYPKFKPLLKAVEEFRTSIRNNRPLIPNYGERYRNGEAIATGFVESTVNQVVSKRFCKKQQMQWSKRGAHLLLQTRVKTLNRELGSVFKQWYPDMEVEEMPDAA